MSPFFDPKNPNDIANKIMEFSQNEFIPQTIDFNKYDLENISEQTFSYINKIYLDNYEHQRLV